MATPCASRDVTSTHLSGDSDSPPSFTAPELQHAIDTSGYRLEMKSEDLTGDLTEAMRENGSTAGDGEHAKQNDDDDFHDIKESMSELHLSNATNMADGMHDEVHDGMHDEVHDGMHSLCSSVVSEPRSSVESSPSRQAPSPRSVGSDADVKTHRYTPSVDSGYHGSTKGGVSTRDAHSGESSADESVMASKTASPQSEVEGGISLNSIPDLVNQIKQGATEFDLGHNTEPHSVTDSMESSKSSLTLDLTAFLRRRKQSSGLKRSPSSPIFNSLQQKLKLKDRVVSPVSPSSPFLGSDGILGATTPTYAKIRHFAQSPVQHFKHLPISRNPFMSPFLASPELLRDLCPMYFVVR